MQNTTHTNRLINETSPYLHQHAHNPVEWYPWGGEALAKAQLENKPILLSVGYSACHWCHVMAHESFEDEATAQVMNALFINIKVDREERPDLDKIYQTAHQLLAQRGGGWPLTMFLAPADQVPFFGGTYFPVEPRYDLPGFKDLLRRISAFYHDNSDAVQQQNISLMNAMQSIAPVGGAAQDAINAVPLDIARRQLEQSFDTHHGGFGRAPKFPHPTHIERLLRHWSATSQVGAHDEKSLRMAFLTLTKMANGGVYDQLGGGFYRYSVDELWMIPHFEKMLYDNGPLLVLYSEAWLITRDPLFKRIAEETAAWVMRDMQSPDGGYYATLDADSEGHEGKFYAWSREEVRSLLSDDEYQIVARRFGLDQPANFGGSCASCDAQGRAIATGSASVAGGKDAGSDRPPHLGILPGEGAWHLHVYEDISALAAELSLAEEQLVTILERARRKLFNARETRIHPGRDEKILTAWNGLMIKGMAATGRHLGRAEYVDSAQRALDFIHEHLWQNGRLLANYKDGRATLPAYLDDYVFLIDGILELLQARWREGDLAFAIALADVVLMHFEDTGEDAGKDKGRGGFYFTADDHEQLMVRPKSWGDDALPSGNGVAAHVLSRLGHLLGDHRYLDAAARAIHAAWPTVKELPYAHNAMLLAVEEYLYPPQTIILRGEPQALHEWQALCTEKYAPRRLTLTIPEDALHLPGVLAQYKAMHEPVAYVCSGLVCGAQVVTREELQRLLAEQ